MNDSTATSPATRGRQAGRRGLGRRSRLALLTVHIVVSVGLLGDSGTPPQAPAATSDNPAVVEASHELLGMFALFFGIPLSFLALLTGAALGLGTGWGLIRYPWVIAKLALTVSVVVVGATVLRPVLFGGAHMDNGALIAGAAYDVVALTVATALGVFKPGKKLRRHQAAAAA